MSDATTSKMLRVLEARAGAPMFLASFFQTPQENFHRSEFVEVDIIRDDPHIAVPVESLSTGSRQVEASKYVNKKYKPPIYDLATSISAWETIKRQPGQDPFMDPSFLANAGSEAMRHLRMQVNMIKRGVELQASQVMQGGALSLVDASGTVIFGLDYQAKAASHATVSTAWATDGSTGDPLTDLGSLADTLRTNGHKNPDVLIFGTSAWQRFKANTKVKDLLNSRRDNSAAIDPELRREGATYQGYIMLDDYRFEMYTYNKTYLHPQTGASTRYVATDKVVMLSSEARYDLTFGEIPRIAATNSTVQQFIPERLSSPGQGFDVSTFAYITPNGRQLALECGTRALCVPTEIDTLGSLDVVP